MNNDKFMNFLNVLAKNTDSMAESPTKLVVVLYRFGKDYFKRYLKMHNISEYDDIILHITDYKNAGYYPFSPLVDKNMYGAACFAKLLFEFIGRNQRDNQRISNDELTREIFRLVKEDDDKNTGLRALINRVGFGISTEAVIEYKCAKEFFKSQSEKDILKTYKKISKLIKIKEDKQKI